jgi:hypothetical protein
MSSPDEWPFDQEPETAALTTRQVLEKREPIRQVVHYSDDHSWAFTHGTSDEKDDYRIVHMSHLFKLDKSLRSIADLPPGWSAWRDAGSQAWERTEENPEEY